MTQEDESRKYIYPDEPYKFIGKDAEAFLIYCTRIGASDVTIQTQEQVFCEIHGRMRKVTNRRLTNSEVSDFISALYGNDTAVGRLNGGEEVDFALEIKPDRNTRMRFRVNCTAISSYGHTGYQITLRTIDGTPPDIKTFGVPDQIIKNVAPKQGMVIITGATGSGKSTLLAGVIRMLCEQPDGHRKILTYEKPIEYVYDEVDKPTTSISQTEIGKHLKTFEDGIVNALRRKPSIILVGEMRDKEAIAEGVTAAMTGHLLYSTLHSNGVADTVRRMVNVFPEGERNARAVDIISSLKMTVAQMLLPSTDGKRVAIREYLVFNEDIVEEMLEAGTDKLTYVTRKILKEQGQTFLQDAEQKYKEGRIDLQEFNRIKFLSRGADRDSGVRS